MKSKWKTITAFLLIIVFVGVGCNKEPGTSGNNNGNNITEVCVTTYTPRDITATTALCGGDVIAPQGFPLSGIGICWGTEHNPTIDNSCSSNEIWDRPYVCQLCFLEPETKYYVRAFALRGLECYYGEEKVFTTEAMENDDDGDDGNDENDGTYCPSIAVLTGENYVYDGQTIDLFQDYKLGFRVASNSQTLKELATFKLETRIYDGPNEEASHEVSDTTIIISGNEYVYEEGVRFELAKRELIGKVEYIVTVTDVNGMMNSVTLTLNLNLAEQPLTVTEFEWFRQGSIQSGLEEYGLYWDQNAKAPFAQIKPLPGVILYKFFDSSVWDEVTWPSQKEAVFSDGAVTASMYNNVDVNQNGTYNDVIGTRMADGKLHLIHVEMCRIGTYTPQGTPYSIFGEAK